jgi:tripartite-type tricarboxylate transporter receptor subunit TctC
MMKAFAQSLCSAMAGLLLLYVPAAGAAENYPPRPVRLIVGAAPGGGTDFVARVINSDLARALGNAVVIDNRGGAAGTLAGELVAKATPDGQTLLLISGNFSTFPSLYRQLSYDPVKDLVPISNLAATPLVVVVNPAVPAKSVKELIDYLRSRSGQINYAAPGVGSMGHLAAELFKRTAQVEMEHIAYKGGGPAITALLGGEVQLYFSTVPAALVQAKAGRLRAIGTTGQKRSRAFPDLPTLGESGLPGYDVTVWFGLLAPAGTAKGIIELLYKKSAEVMSNESVLNRLLAEGVEPIASSPDQFRAQIERENKNWAEVIRSANVKAN